MHTSMSYVLAERAGITTLSVIQDDARPRATPSAEEDGAETPVLQALKALVESLPD